MVQTALTAFWHSLAQLGRGLHWLAFALGVALLALLLVGLLDRERFRAGLTWTGTRLPLLGRWGLAALALGTGVLGLNVVRQAVDTRLATQGSARYANAADPDGGPTVQAAPQASYLDETTYTRSLVLPRSVLTRIEVEGGWEALLPYLGQGVSPNVTALREGFVQQKNSLIYTRDAVLSTEKPVSLEASAVKTSLKFVDPAGGRGSYYNALFEASYAFVNPTTQARIMRFVFPLPTGSGTLSGFRLNVNGQDIRAADLTQGPVWEGEVPAGGQVNVKVTYRNQGARGWSYQLGQRREAIRRFDLTVQADRPAKFQRYSLFPTAQTGGGLGGPRTLHWNLSDVITAQDVAVVFTGSNLRETLGKIGWMKPFAALVAAALALLWAWTRRLTLSPLALAAGLLGLSLGWALGGVLGFYLPVVLAEVLGAAAGVALGLYALGRPFAPPLLLAALLPLVFLTGGHASLLLTLLATVALVLVVAPLRQSPSLAP